MHQFAFQNVYFCKTELKSPKHQDMSYFWNFVHISPHAYLQVVQPFYQIITDPTGSLFGCQHCWCHIQKEWFFLGRWDMSSQDGPKMTWQSRERRGTWGFMVAKGWNFCILARTCMIWNPHWSQRKELHFLICLPTCGAEGAKGYETYSW